MPAYMRPEAKENLRGAVPCALKFRDRRTMNIAANEYCKN